MIFGSGSGAGPAEHPGGAASASEDRPSTPDVCAFLRRPQAHNAFRSHRQFAVLYSDAATTATGPSGRRELGTDRMTTTQVSSIASASAALLHPSSVPVHGPVLRKASVIGGLSQTPFLLPRHRMPACVPLSRHRQSSDYLACTWNSCATRPTKRASIFYLFPILVLAHVSLQAFLDFNAIYTLIE